MVSATYICPVRGLSGLEPPEWLRFGGVTKNAGLTRAWAGLNFWVNGRQIIVYLF